MDGLPGRANQKRRTRKDLLQAAAQLMKQGRRPSLDEVAEAALVSRATAYRYFPSTDALLAEASLDVVTPDAAALFASNAPADPAARLEKVDAALHDMMLANEPALRLMLANALQRAARGEVEGETPLRQNRRTPLIEAALEPVRRQFKPGSLDLLAKALALIVGTEAMVVFKDVLQVDDAEARRVKRWAIRALVEAAKR
jgi:AcrR family transcriptional regulator